MTEVRSTSNQGLGLYATKIYQPGDIILEENALFTFNVSSSNQRKETIRSQFQKKNKQEQSDSNNNNNNNNNNDKKKISFDAKADDNEEEDLITFSNHFLSDLIRIPSDVDKQKYGNKFLGMVTAAATYADAISSKKLSDESKEKILQLYSPSECDAKGCSNDNENEYESAVHTLATKAVAFMEENAIESSSLHSFVKENEQECMRIMLIWACNAFQGGLLYDVTSRINHSCDFNTVICTDQNNESKQIVKAACEIQPNDEINISYLGSYTYADLYQRRQILRRDKFFDCHCSRCVREEKFGLSSDSYNVGDIASSIPCTSYHERVSGRYLEEDVQYDDDEDNPVHYAVKNYSSKSENEIEKIYISCKDGVKSAFTLTSTLSATIEKTVDRIINHLDELESSSGVDDNEEELVEMTEKLLCLSYSVLGSKHYCTNLLLLQSLSQKLSGLHSTMMCNSIQKDKKRKKDKKQKAAASTEVNMIEVAESIDMLERCYKFINGLGLKSHPGHLVGNVTIGISRVLVGLGDLTSMKFGADWVEKVEDFFKCGYENYSMEKVVATLKNAWKRKSEEDANKQPSAKRIKF